MERGSKKRAAWRLVPLIAGVILLCLSACGKTEPLPAEPHSIRVMIADGENYTVRGENPILAKPGEDAVFALDMTDTAVCLDIRGGVFDEKTHTVTVPAVRYPTTVTMRVAADRTRYKFFVENPDQTKGKVTSSQTQGNLYEGTRLSVTAKPKTKDTFVGWSLERPLKSGGTLVSTDITYSFTLERDTFLYPNWLEASIKWGSGTMEAGYTATQPVTYHGNGGVYAATGKADVVIDVPLATVYQNTLPDKGQFTRDGHILIEYNTRPDGTGDGYSLGSKLYAAWDEKPELYCIWAKISPETDFEYEIAPEGAAVTSYKGNAETIAIPPELGGVPVVRVKRDAFRSKSFKTLVIPKSVLYVESNAFGTTSAFTTLYLWDTILSIPDNAFTNQTGFANFRLNASLDPTYTNETEGNFVIKWCRLVSLSKAAKKPMFILVSGSSSLYGLNSAKMEEYLGGRYDVVNYGTQAGSSSVFYLEAISRYVHEGDIVVHAPEMGTATMGGTELSWRIFRGTEAYYNIWREVDMRNYTGVFSALTEFNATRIHMTPLNYLTISNNINEYGDCKNRDGYDKLNKENYSGGSNFSLSTGTLNAARAKTLNAAYAKLIAKGAKVYMSCAPCNLNAVRSERRTEAAKAEYTEALRKQVSVPLISFIGDYMFEGKYMYNSDYHLNAFGRDIRTEQLFEDLQKQFEKEEREMQR